MKIGLITWGFDTADGVGRCVVESAKRLAVENRVTVFAATANHPEVAGVELKVLPLRLRGRYPREIEYLCKIAGLIRSADCDILHAHIPALIPADLLTCHSLPAALLENRDLPWKVRVPYQLQNALYRYHLGRAQGRIVAVSEKVKSEIVQRYDYPVQRISAIANGVDLERFSPQTVGEHRLRMRKQLALDDGQFVFMLVGSTLRLKGMHFAAKALQRLPERAVLLVVGHGNPAEMADDAELIDSLQQSGRLRFVVPDQDIAAYYAAADALMAPSQYESFGLVVLEAMACGLPVITASTVGLAIEAIADGVSGLVVTDPGDIDGLVAKASYLLSDTTVSRAIGAEARVVAERYSWERHVEKTQALYRQILRSRDLSNASTA
ncbi:glycosyltransferase family 4 protein [Methylomonas sp. HYX-M1]|uniref:glycosyltransferase family 4 protein n=1 Tax=Methylomonas sp. HYX-M1 TaxID=3139307 RepID=UPI00345C4D0C